MSLSEQCVFVLWGKHCQEVPTAVFVTTLRAAGIQVKVIGLSGSQAAGAHGLTLLSDLTLSEALALAHAAACVIIACQATLLVRFQNDPRLGQLLHTIRGQGGRFIVAEEAIRDLLGLQCQAQMEIYPPDGALLAYAHTLARSLLV